MNRPRLFILAALAGLLAGWPVSLWIGGRDGSAGFQMSAGAGAGLAPQRSPGELRAAWKELIETRTPPVPAWKDASEFHNHCDAVLRNRAFSPGRRRLGMELARAGLPASQLGSSFAVRWRSADGNAGAEHGMARMAKHNPAAGLSWAESLAAGTKEWADAATLDKLRRAALRGALQADPQAALASVLATTSHYRRRLNLRALMEEWSQTDPAAAAAALTSLPEGGPGFQSKDYAEAVMRGWHRIDPVAARAWAEAQTDPLARDALHTLTAELSATGPGAKAEVLLASSLREGDRLSTALADWLTADPSAALTKLAAVPLSDTLWQDDAEQAAQFWAFEASAEMTPAQFVEVLKTMPAGPRRDTILKGLAEHGSANDIPFALRMIAEIGEGAARSQAMISLTNEWMRSDPEKLSQWLAAQPPGESRHAAVSRFAELLARTDPEAAARWTDTLPDGSEQKANLIRTVRDAWQRTDPAAASGWNAR